MTDTENAPKRGLNFDGLTSILGSLRPMESTQPKGMTMLDTQNALLDYSDTDECNACAAVEDQCPHHRGVAVGIQQARAALTALADS